MANGKKVTITIRVNDFIREKLREQAHALGMNVSDYVAYLVLFKKYFINNKEKERD